MNREADYASEQAPPANDPDSTAERLRVAEEKILRLTAELANVHKRSQRELESERRYAESARLQDLLPVADNLRRAKTAVATARDRREMENGLEIVAGQLQDVLTRHGCTEIPAAGLPFDPDVHEALRMVSALGTPPGVILEVVEPGNRLHDRVIRPARVVVSGQTSNR